MKKSVIFLDTDIISYFLSDDEGLDDDAKKAKKNVFKIIEHIIEEKSHNFAVSALSYSELSVISDIEESLNKVFSFFQIVDYDFQCANYYTKLHRQYDNRRLKTDRMILATAARYGAAYFITNNIKDYSNYDIKPTTILSLDQAMEVFGLSQTLFE